MKVLVVIDMQNDFVTGSLGNKDAEAIIPNVVAKVDEYLNQDDKVFFTMDTHSDNEYLISEEGKNLPVKHCIGGTEGWEIVRPLQKYLDDDNTLVFEKDTFGSIKLAEAIKDYWRDLLYMDITIELVGLCTDICVVSNALLIKAFCDDAHIIVDAACCAGSKDGAHDVALATMASCHCEIINHWEEPWR